MKIWKIFVSLLIFLLLLGCNGKKEFNFKKDWTWEELSQFTEDNDTKEYISYLEKKISLEDAYFVFRELDKIKNPENIYLFSKFEKFQKENGGQFFSIIPDFFKKKDIIPPADTFDHIIANALYYTRIKEIADKNLYLSGFMYNLKFRNNELKPVDRQGSKLDLELNTDMISDILNIYESKKVHKKEITKIANNKIFEDMLRVRSTISKFTDPVPTQQTIAYFIQKSAETDPLNKLWNWMNPANNFGFSELSINRENYKKLISTINDNNQIFKDRVLAKLAHYIPLDFHYKQDINFAVNFGQKIWSSKDGIGVNIVHIKDDFISLTGSIRKEVYLQILEKLNQENNTLEPDFGNEKDKDYYDILKFIFYEGTANYIGFAPPQFDYVNNAKESNSALEQIQKYMYNGKKPELLKSLKTYSMGENGYFTGLGFLMARTIEKKMGKETLKKCIQNGPIYFFKTYTDLQIEKKTKRYFNYDQVVIDKINEFYNLQSKHYVK